MSRVSKFTLVLGLIVFILACNTLTRPLNEAQDAVKTAEAIASSMPVETLQAAVTALPVKTLEALPSSIPDLETAIPDVTHMLNPQGQPAAEWNNIPVMTDATAGQEFSSTSYSFATPSTPTQVKDFYDAKLKDLGWTPFMFGSKVTDEGGLMMFQMDKSLLTVTVVKDPNGDKNTVVNFQLVSQ